MSTTRLVYSSPNYELNRNIIAVAFERDAKGNALRMGDIIRIAKNRSGNNTNKRNFLLLGDPAVRLSWPWHGNVITDSINEVPVGELTDTLKALSVITLPAILRIMPVVVQTILKVLSPHWFSVNYRRFKPLQMTEARR
jgi:hypothetical protein